MSKAGGEAEAPPPDPAVTRKQVGRSAVLATMGRLGALIDAIAQPVYSWLFGLATYGIYTVLWSVVNIIENIVDLSMTQALQRAVPGAEEESAHAAVRFALLVSIIPACLVALLLSVFAAPLAGLVSAAPEDRATLPLVIALFAWTLPLWTFVEVATSAARARRAFGPEIRLRIFWEQVARLIFAIALFAAGFEEMGLFMAHILSLLVTSVLCVRLLGRYYDLRLLVTARASRAQSLDLLGTGIALLPLAITRRLFSDLPPVILNLLLPGARGAAAAGLFGVARKLASIPLIIRQAFLYVLAPLATAQAAQDRRAIAPLYRFSCRISTALVVPLAALLILLAPDILSIYKPEFRDAVPLVVILVLGRAVEGIFGPATAVVEMLGHRGLPLLNSLLGLGAWALLGFILVPTTGSVGMAIGVSVGIMLVAVAATVELRVSEGIRLYDRKLLRGLAVALAGCAVMAAAGEVLQEAGGPIRAAALLLIFYPAATWLAVRFGLAKDDRAALGKAGRFLRLTPRPTQPG